MPLSVQASQQLAQIAPKLIAALLKNPENLPAIVSPELLALLNDPPSLFSPALRTIFTNSDFLAALSTPGAGELIGHPAFLAIINPPPASPSPAPVGPVL